MARIYSTLLTVGNVAGAGDTAIYTAPATGVVVVRDVVVLHDDTTNRRVSMYGTSGGVGGFITGVASVVPNNEVHWDGRQVLRPGEVLHIVTTATTNTTYRVSGYVFDS